MALVCGIDEAGRGPILGPMVVAGVLLDEAAEPGLRALGVKDSKRFTGKHAVERRGALALEIRRAALRVALRVLSPAEIDAENLGALERRTAFSLLTELRPPGRIVADGRSIFSPLERRFRDFRAEDKADVNHLAVAAASIIAKDERDRRFGRIRERYEPEFGPIEGGGYPNPKTMVFLDAYRARYGDLPPEARRKWSIRTECSQTR